MSKDLFKTFAESTLAASITTATTSFSVAAGEGGKFPAITGTDFFICVLLNKSNGDVEVVKVTARSVDTFTVVRDYEGAGPKAFNSGDIIRLSCVASTLNNFLQASAQTNTIQWDDDGPGSGPTLDLHRNSQTPADGDLLGNILFSGEDDLSNKVTYGEILGIAKDVTNATTDGRILIRTMNNNVLTDQINISNSFIDFYNDVYINQSSEPYFYLYRNDASPSSGDDIGSLFFRGEDSASNGTNYARITGNIVTVTDGSEQGELQFLTKIASVTYRNMRVRSDVITFLPKGNSGYDNSPGAGANGEYGLHIQVDKTSGACYIDSFSPTGSTDIRFGTNSSGGNVTEVLRLESNGSAQFIGGVGIGKSYTASLSGSAGISLATAGYMLLERADSVMAMSRLGTQGVLNNFYYNMSTNVGNISITNTATSYNTSSSRELKENIAPIKDALSRIMQLNPISANFKHDKEKKKMEMFVAEEVQHVCDYATDCDHHKDKTAKMIDYSKFTPLLTAGIQELVSRVRKIERQLEAK